MGVLYFWGVSLSGWKRVLFWFTWRRWEVGVWVVLEGGFEVGS